MSASRRPRLSGTARGTAVSRLQIEAAVCPLDAILEEHFLQRQLTVEMEQIARSDRPMPGLAREILLNLCRDLPLHHADEDQSLFPRLCERAAPEDEIAPLLERLEADHQGCEKAIASLVPALGCMCAGALPAPEDRAALMALAQAERRHLIVENAIVLPLARIRLSAADKMAVHAEMRARRRDPPPLDPLCARALAGIGAGFESDLP